jgi:hypothetical protein
LSSIKVEEKYQKQRKNFQIESLGRVISEILKKSSAD